MFRPRSILQALVALVFLSGCANTYSDINEPQQINQEKPADIINKPIDSSRSYHDYALANYGFGDFLDNNQNLLPEFQQFANQIANDHQIDQNHIESILKTARYESTAARLMTPPAHKRPIKRAWQSYKKRHVDPIRIKSGLQFWQQNKAQLDAVSTRSGVPQSIIVAIIGIETVYGRYTGDHRVLDTLATLGFRYPDSSRPERQQMFRSQLADLIILHEQRMLDAYSAKGSYAGAMGLSQFMPTSLLNYAIDGDGDGIIDLHHSRADAIASIASFLLAHGWQPNTPVFAAVDLNERGQQLEQDGLKPSSNWQELENNGARISNSGHYTPASWQNAPLGVINLRDEIRDTQEYRVATVNFFAITEYNRSYFYASSVADLAYAIADKMGYAYPY